MQITAYVYQSLLAASFLVSVKPYEDLSLNYLEFVFECYLLLTSYVLLLFSDLVEVEMRY